MKMPIKMEVRDKVCNFNASIMAKKKPYQSATVEISIGVLKFMIVLKCENALHTCVRACVLKFILHTEIGLPIE